MVDPVDGNVDVAISYTTIDDAGKESATAGTANIEFLEPVSITGTLFNDVDNSAAGTHNGIQTGSEIGVDVSPGTPIYAYLVDPVTGNIIQSDTLTPAGTYAFSGITPNANVKIVISTTPLSVGAAAPTPSVPAGWVSTSPLDTTLNVGTPIPALIQNINFGAQQPPTSGDSTLTSQANPLGTVSVPVPAGSFVNNDVNGGIISAIKITAFPTGATSITINGTTYTSGSFPLGGVTVPTNAAGDPTQAISVDPASDGATTVVIPFVSIDNGGAESPTTGHINVPFAPLAINGTVFNDVNGNSDNTVNGTGLGNPGGTTLYANLLDGSGNVVATVPVNNDGTYSFTSGVAPNTNYTVQVSTNAGTVGNPAPATALPTGWVPTGENLGSGAGNDGTANGNLPVAVGTTNVTNANFGIEQPPTANTATAASQTNPGGTTSVTVPAATFGGTDLSGGTVDSIRITAFPSNATSIIIDGITYTSGTFPAGGVTILAPGGVPAVAISVDPVDGTVTVAIPYVTKDNAGIESTTPGLASQPFTPLSISGNVFNDINGATDNTVNGTGLGNPSGTTLYANLLDGAGNVVATVPVNNDGTYTLNSGIVSNTNYTVQISTNQGTVASPAPITALPTGWIATGEYLGTGVGNDGTINGNLPIAVGTTNITNANFGIEEPPTANTTTAATLVNPGGTVSATVPSSTFGGTDASGGTVDSIRITGFPTNATSITINGVTYTSATFPVGGVTVLAPGGVPAVPISVDPIDGGVTVAIPYVTKDNAGIESTTPGVANQPFAPTFSVSGNVFNDVNGLNPTPVNTVDGTGTNAGGINAILVDQATGNVIATVPVNADGTYNFTGIPAGNYTTLLSTTAGTVGAVPPAASLPSGWANTGENNGTGAGSDGTANGTSATIAVTTANVSDVNFGIEQLPTADTNYLPVALNPTGTNDYTVPSTLFSGSDPDGGTITAIKITSFPANVTTITINGTQYTSATFPVGGVTVPTNAAGNPTQPILVDPVDGNVDVAISYTTIDDAGKESATAGTANIEFLEPVSITGTLFNDVDNSAAGTHNGIQTGSEIGVDVSPGTPIYAYLVDPVTGNIIQSDTLTPAGTYAFSGITPNANVKIVISTTPLSVGAAAPTPSVPAGWVSTSPLDTTLNVGTPIPALIQNINFGAQQPPTSGDSTLTSQANPLGTVSVPVPAGSFVNNDVNGGIISAIKITAFPTGATSITINGTTYTSGSFPLGGVTVPTNAAGDPTQAISVDPASDGATTVVIPFVSIDNGGAESPTTGHINVPFAPLAINGTVFNDVNGNSDNTVNGTGLGNPGGTTLYANLLDGSGNVVATVPVNNDGTYSFTSGVAPNTNYTVQVSTNAGTVGNPAPATALPTGWVPTGENLGSGAGNDGTANGNLPVAVGTTNVTNANFGIEQPPTANTASETIQTNPGGVNTVSVSLGLFGGTDASGGTVDSIRITAFPSNTTSITIDGVTYTSGTFPAGGVTILAPSGVPAVTIEIDPIDGGVTVAIPYVTKDNAGIESTTPGSVNVPFAPTFTVSGNVYNDINGNTDNLVNGVGTNAGGLFAVLLDNLGTVIQSVPVNADGTYTFDEVPAGNYNVILNDVAIIAGTLNPTPVLPATWASTGELNGTGSGDDGTTDTKSNSFTVSNSNISNINFGIEQTSSAANIVATAQGNPGGTTSATVQANTFAGTDPSASGSVTGIKITAFPTNATSITIDGINYTSATFPVGGVTVNANTSGEPTVPILVDPIDGSSVTVSIPYVTIDNAGLPSTIGGTANIPFFQTLPVTFISFAAVKVNNTSALHFTIAQSVLGSVFTIERSGNGYNFNAIGSLNATNAINYSFNDNNVILGAKNYYRIKEIDVIGNVTYSKIQVVKFTNETKVDIYPNPTTSYVNIALNDISIGKQLLIKLYDATGKLMLSKNIKTVTSTEQINVSSFANGNYQLQIIDVNKNSTISNTKLIIAH